MRLDLQVSSKQSIALSSMAHLTSLRFPEFPATSQSVLSVLLDELLILPSKLLVLLGAQFVLLGSQSLFPDLRLLLLSLRLVLSGAQSVLPGMRSMLPVQLAVEAYRESSGSTMPTA